MAIAKMSPRSPNASGIAAATTSPSPISTNSITRAAGCSGSIQFVARVVHIHTPHSAIRRKAGLQRMFEIGMSEQDMRELRHREDEDEIKEELDKADAAVILTGARAQGAAA